MHGSSNRDLVVDRPETVDTARFEEVGAFLLTTTSNACPQPDQGGTYEILVLENGNLEFVAVDEDTCAARSGGPLDRELAPVP